MNAVRLQAHWTRWESSVVVELKTELKRTEHE